MLQNAINSQTESQSAHSFPGSQKGHEDMGNKFQIWHHEPETQTLCNKLFTTNDVL
jgi:hypothetical protein